MNRTFFGSVKQWGAVALAAGAMLVAGQAEAKQVYQQPTGPVLCVYDPMGTAGEYFSLYKDYQLAAKRWGVSLQIKAYLDDNALNDAFKAGKCDIASMIGMRAREFNQFTGTIDSPGTIENYSQLRDVMNIAASPKVAKYMISGPYEMVGVVPVGAGYAVVNDRRINGLAAAVGKRAAYMSWDKTQTMITEDFHLIAVPSDLNSYGRLFNKGDVDIIVAPMALYKPMELYRGIGTAGGIVHRPLFQFTMQLVARRDRLPPDFGQESREYMSSQVDHALGIIRNDEDQIDSRNWIYAMHADVVTWNTTMRDLLNHLMDQGLFDGRMLAILQRVRCKSNPYADECVGGGTPTYPIDGVSRHH